MSVQFMAAEIRRLLDILGVELGRRGVGASMYVVGEQRLPWLTRRVVEPRTSMLHLFLVIRCSAAAAVAEAEGIPLSP
ncbi:MAG: hypothetical protein ACR2HA_04860 [Nocardioides sp.]